MSAGTLGRTVSGSGQGCSSGGIWPGRRESQRKQEVRWQQCLTTIPPIGAKTPLTGVPLHFILYSENDSKVY
jgi:hypothetical protein